MLNRRGTTGGGKSAAPGGDVLNLTVVDSKTGKPIVGATFTGKVTSWSGAVAMSIASSGKTDATGEMSLSSPGVNSSYSGTLAAPGYESTTFDYLFPRASTPYQNVVNQIANVKTGLTKVPAGGGSGSGSKAPPASTFTLTSTDIVILVLAIVAIIGIFVIVGVAK